MGQKVNPKSIRIKINETWKSAWFNDKNYSDNLINDLKLRKILRKELKSANISDIIINRDPNQIVVTIRSSRPGLIIGKGGSGSGKIKDLIEAETGKKAKVNIEEIKKPDLDAKNIAQNIASQLEKRIPFRRVIKQAVEKAEDSGAKGVRVRVSGRLNGADIARSEKATSGTIPLSHYRSKIDYASDTALTTYGIIGIKVWVYLSE